MQSKTFTRIFIAIVVIATAWMFVYLAGMVREAVPFPSDIASSTPTGAAAPLEATSSVPAAAPEPSSALATTTVLAPKGVIHVEIASDEASREQGLSGRAFLPKDSGMLFVFPSAGAYGFWMKDMDFPIDLAWIGADKRTIGVVPGMEPSSYPEVYYPEGPIRYVLEMPAGAARAYGIATGTRLVF